MYNILLALDNSDYSKQVINLGIEVAKNIDAKLNLLFVVENKIIYHPFVPMVFNPVMDGFDFGDAYSGFYDKAKDKIKVYGKEILKKAGDDCKKNNIESVCFIREGILAEEIIDLSSENDLIIMGRYGVGVEHSNYLLGSAVEEVARMANKPLIISSEQINGIENIALAFDNSEFANKTLRLAFWMKKVWKKELKFEIFSVVDNVDEADKMEEIIKGLISEHEDFSAKVLLSDSTEEMILSYIKENPIDLLMMGAYGHSRIRELILGSTTSSVIRKIGIPVLLNR
ncbi:MAG: universal stress protein [Candidatus Muirbacterium halophilum]|nr:universal stress protein [Candidatus Muirbacterium halophilum]MCK9474434.1 universal stress protein [Candidatus Muirbacterium halophilum]